MSGNEELDLIEQVASVIEGLPVILVTGYLGLKPLIDAKGGYF